MKLVKMKKQSVQAGNVVCVCCVQVMWWIVWIKRMWRWKWWRWKCSVQAGNVVCVCCVQVTWWIVWSMQSIQQQIIVFATCRWCDQPWQARVLGQARHALPSGNTHTHTHIHTHTHMYTHKGALLYNGKSSNMKGFEWTCISAKTFSQKLSGNCVWQVPNMD